MAKSNGSSQSKSPSKSQQKSNTRVIIIVIALILILIVGVGLFGFFFLFNDSPPLPQQIDEIVGSDLPVVEPGTQEPEGIFEKIET